MNDQTLEGRIDELAGSLKEGDCASARTLCASVLVGVAERFAGGDERLAAVLLRISADAAIRHKSNVYPTDCGS